MLSRLAFKILLATLVLLPVPASGQQTPSEEIKQLKSEIQELRANQAELQRQIRELQKLLSPRPATTTAAPARDIFVSTEGAAFKGDAKAPITLIEYSDYQCPFCSRAFLQIAPQLERDFISTGKLKYVFIDLPIESAHPLALTASIAARCAGEQGK
ncbi:MAG TPA: thioredoxin domain-containing protein, partial [Pyrinomonadaceae bacterium]|nr:thioredoxin domain-containing protein [Pyrinomonadaceae bacterium]